MTIRKYSWLVILLLLIVLMSSQIVMAQTTTSSWALDWSPDGTQIAFGQLDGTIQIIDANSNELLSTLQTHNSSLDTSTMVVLKWSPDSTKLAAADMSKRIYWWDIDKGQLLYSLVGKNTSYITNIAWSADSKRLAAVSQLDGELQIWDASTGKLLIQHDSGYLLGLDWYRNYLVSSTGNGVILFDANTGDFLRDVGIQEAQVTDVAWSPLGDLIASGGNDGKIHIWDADSEHLIKTFGNHNEAITTVNWRSDGQEIVSSSYDGTVRIWDIATGELVRTIEHGLQTFRAAFSPDGTQIASGDANSVLQLESTFVTPTSTPQNALPISTAVLKRLK